MGHYGGRSREQEKLKERSQTIKDIKMNFKTKITKIVVAHCQYTLTNQWKSIIFYSSEGISMRREKNSTWQW